MEKKNQPEKAYRNNKIRETLSTGIVTIFIVIALSFCRLMYVFFICMCAMETDRTRYYYGEISNASLNQTGYQIQTALPGLL